MQDQFLISCFLNISKISQMCYVPDFIISNYVAPHSFSVFTARKSGLPSLDTRQIPINKISPSPSLFYSGKFSLGMTQVKQINQLHSFSFHFVFRELIAVKMIQCSAHAFLDLFGNGQFIG